MKVIVASTVVPFLKGGYTVIIDSLVDRLRAEGKTVEKMLFPFSSRWDEILDQMLAFRLMDLSQHGDRLITVRFPSYLLQHPNKTVWFIHHHRGAYDLWGTEYQDIPMTPEGVRVRDSIRNADAAALAECRPVFANSKIVAGRLKQFNGVSAEVLYPPLPCAEAYHCAGYSDYILYLGRLVHHKRQWLAIEAMRYVETGVRLVIAGKPDPDALPYLAELHALVDRHNLQDRVTILADWLPEGRKVEMFAECLAGAYFPLDEDSFGYPSLEAHCSGKAVITTTDSGGTLELVRNGENGLVMEPTALAIARGMDAVYRNRALARAMGDAGRARMDALGINWEHVTRRLLA